VAAVRVLRADYLRMGPQSVSFVARASFAGLI
jgi:hypothetical protein